ncbi:hypothetical protein ACAF76_008395 [Brevibacillus sp. TJ4]|uniref:hypothetical protein n=1 Tax=Brevibacillus sp. TJ4 TaxID=3234853 RepID=UPI0037D6CEBD
MSKPNDVLAISKGKEKLKVTRKAFQLIYSQHGYKVDDDPSPETEKAPVTTDGDSDK